MDKLLTNKLYDIFYTQYKGTLSGLNIRYKEYKGAPEEQEWLSNIIEDSADLLGLVKQQFETELQNNHEHTVLVKIEDWSALMDTMGAVAFVAAILVIVTILLNAITLIVYRDRTVK